MALFLLPSGKYIFPYNLYRRSGEFTLVQIKIFSQAEAFLLRACEKISVLKGFQALRSMSAGPTLCPGCLPDGP